jgi:uncharacterized protein (TIGR02118 family)
MAFQLTALYNHPDDTAAFDQHYDGTHAPLAATLPGLRSYTVSRPGPDAQGNAFPYHLVAVLTFDDEAALNSALATEQGQATVADLANFAGAGVALGTADVHQVVEAQ